MTRNPIEHPGDPAVPVDPNAQMAKAAANLLNSLSHAILGHSYPPAGKFDVMQWTIVFEYPDGRTRDSETWIGEAPDLTTKVYRCPPGTKTYLKGRTVQMTIGEWTRVDADSPTDTGGSST